MAKIIKGDDGYVHFELMVADLNKEARAKWGEFFGSEGPKEGQPFWGAKKRLKTSEELRDSKKISSLIDSLKDELSRDQIEEGIRILSGHTKEDCEICDKIDCPLSPKYEGSAGEPCGSHFGGVAFDPPAE